MNGNSDTYRGPVVVLCAAEHEPLEALLVANPRPWNKELRERLKHAKEVAESAA